MPNILLNSINYFIQSQGAHSETKPALILLHGSGGDSSVWIEQLDALSETLHVIVPDLPGHGHSKDGFIDDTEAYAQQFARMFPEMLKGLVLIGTGMRFTIPPGYLDMLHQDFANACLISSRQAFAAHMPSDMLERGIAMLHRNGHEVLLRDLSLCAGFDSTAWAWNLAMPCLIICGTQDVITPCALSHELAKTITDSTLKVIDESGHMVMQEQPDIFNNEISLFIKKKCCAQTYET
jgi:pimeloyl-ACP methyl ester carboxylesterase